MKKTSSYTTVILIKRAEFQIKYNWAIFHKAESCGYQSHSTDSFFTPPQFTKGIGQHTNKQAVGVTPGNRPAGTQQFHAAWPGGPSTNPHLS